MRTPGIIFICLFLINNAIANEVLNSLRIFNSLLYTVQVGKEGSPDALLKTIEPGKEIGSTKYYDYLYVERGLDGADPWVFNLRVQSFVSTKPLVLVLTKEGLYVVHADKFDQIDGKEIKNIKANAIGRVTPLD